MSFHLVTLPKSFMKIRRPTLQLIARIPETFPTFLAVSFHLTNGFSQRKTFRQIIPQAIGPHTFQVLIHLLQVEIHYRNTLIMTTLVVGFSLGPIPIGCVTVFRGIQPAPTLRIGELLQAQPTKVSSTELLHKAVLLLWVNRNQSGLVLLAACLRFWKDHMMSNEQIACSLETLPGSRTFAMSRFTRAVENALWQAFANGQGQVKIWRGVIPSSIGPRPCAPNRDDCWCEQNPPHSGIAKNWKTHDNYKLDTKDIKRPSTCQSLVCLLSDQKLRNMTTRSISHWVSKENHIFYDAGMWGF